MTEAEIEAAARAHDDEWERWIFRRKIDKSGYEAVREHDTSAPISEDNQTVFNLDRDGDTAEANFTVIRSHAATKAALEAAEAAGWEKIETAPKDGTVFDAWLGDASQSDVDFYCTRGTRRSPSWHWYIGKFRPVGGLHSITDPPIPIFVQPTYWRPLPSPPAVQEDK